jgi:uncharacterized membrane protein
MVTSRFALVLVLSAAPARADWEKFSDKEGVLVEWRKVEGARNREIRATGKIDQPLRKLVAVLRDIEHWPDFMPPTEKVNVYDDRGDTRRIHVTINPSMVSRRDYCVEVVWKVTADSAYSQWVQIPDGCPPQQKGVVRHTRTDGTWKLRALDAQRTFIEYQAITDPAGNIPPWMVDRATAKTMFGMFRSLARRAAELK